MVKTINLNGSEIRVTELGGDNTEIFNNGSGTIYASKLPNISAGGDDVIAIPPGAIDGLYGTRGTVYLLGSGSVEVRGVDHKITKARGQSAATGGGVSQSYVDEKCGEVLENANAYSDSIKAELAGFIGYTDSDIYGLEADFENCKFARLAGAVGKKAGADFDNVNAYGGRRRCNLSDSGEVLAYYGDENFKADGSNGQVMVEQPKFYYRVVPLKTEKIDGADGYHLRKARYYISDSPKAGFKVHPAFVRGGVEVDKIYLSAFEGCIYDTSAETYLLNDEQIADFDNDKLSSIAGAKPCSGLYQKLIRANMRKLTHNRGNGWELSSIQSISATQLLFIIEYSTPNSQNAVGNGVTEKVDDKNTNMSETTGSSLHQDTLYRSVLYRGEENLWGNMWNLIEGILVKNPENYSSEQFGKLFVSAYDFSDNIDDGVYEYSGITPCGGSGYISSFGYSEKYDWMFIPTRTTGNSAAPVGDSYWNGGAGLRLISHGGHWSSGENAGIFNQNIYRGISGYTRETGARIQYAKLGQT
ncbi:MAG: hypothetical protein NC401_19930 [Ruminococcus sp.]|nr:hypothetical protein [Ruminococcus sp.]